MPDEDTTVLRYLSLSALITRMKTGRLRLTRVDKFQDPFEGSVPKQQMDDQDTILNHSVSERRCCGRSLSIIPEE
jgi:hypothetical protein